MLRLAFYTELFLFQAGPFEQFLGYVQSSPHRVHTEWQRPLSGVHSIMMEQLAQAGEDGECTPAHFQFIYHHIQSCSVRSS